MIEALSSLALIGSGAYLYLKGKGEKTDTTGSKTSVDSQSSADRIIAQKKSQGDTSVDKTSDYNARGESVVEQGGEQIAMTTENKMYFGDNENYDQFYDYTGVANESILKHSSAVDITKGTLFRARIVAPFLAETDFPKDIYHYLLSTEKRICYKGATPTPYFSHVRTSDDKLEDVVEFAYGECSYIAFVLEVFNPYSIPSTLSQIGVSEIKIGEEKCYVFNADAGVLHESTDEQLLINKHVFRESSGVWKFDEDKYAHPLIINTGGVKIPAQDSIFIPIFLPLVVVDEISDATTNVRSIISHTGHNEWYTRDDSNKMLESQGMNYRSLHGHLEPTTYQQALADKNTGNNTHYIFVKYRKPKSLAQYNLEIKVTLSSDSQNLSHNYENGNTDVYSVSAHYLTMNHSIRKGYDKIDSWKDSYMGDAIPNVSPSVTKLWDALSDNILKYNGGHPIYDGFQFKDNYGYQCFENDLTSKYLG